MRSCLILFFLLLAVICRSQQGSGKTAVFKVRAPKSECAIFVEGGVLWLEKDNHVRIRVKGKNQKIQVDAQGPGARIVGQDGELYALRFTSPGQAAISVYQAGPYGRELLCTRKYEIKGPTLYFCGVKTDSTSNSISLRNSHLYAYSEIFKKDLPIVSFEMFFTEDTNRIARSKPQGKPIRMKSDTCQLTPEMRRRVLNYQPKFNYIYLHAIICEVPDGTKRILDPIRLHVVRDTTAKENLHLIYEVKRKEF